MLRAVFARLLLVLPLSVLACERGDPDPTPPQPAPVVDAPPSWPQPSATDPVGQAVVSAIDAATDPCVDFYQFACGRWLADTKLPADESRYGRGFSELRDRNNEVLKTVLEGFVGKDGDQGKAGTIYTSCMDQEAIDARGIEPLAPWLAKIDKVKNLRGVMELTGEMHRTVFSGGGPLFSLSAFLDFEDPDLYIGMLMQGGTGLPDRSFYLDEAKAPILAAYTGHVATMLTISGIDADQAAKDAAAVVAFETELAKISRPRDQMVDPSTLYHRLDRKGVEKAGKGLDWKRYFKAAGYPTLELINVGVPEFLEGLPAVVKATDMATLRSYLRAQLVGSAASSLSSDVEAAAFAFRGALTGQQEMAPRFERCLGVANGAVSDVIGQGFVEVSFAGDSRAIAVEMITTIEDALKAALPKLEWMDDTTRAAALGKIDKVKNKIGYPDKWRSFEKLELPGDHFGNQLAAGEFNWRFEMDRIGTKVDPEEWIMPASIVNAAYNPLANEMNFPAGILQPPFFSRDFPKAMNYGAIGLVMGHELTHGFDSAGRKFDGDGVLTEWWAPDVITRFEEKTACIEDAYSEFEVLPGQKVNGTLTLGENIADFGGLKESFAAYGKWVADHGTEEAIVDGLSNEQLYFVAYAQSWCSITSPEMTAMLLTVDPHSPSVARVNLPLSHFPGFWETFACDEGTPMHAENACEVW